MTYFTQLLIICPLVFLSGFIDSVAGGGGLISTPAFMMAGLPMHNVLATNKVSACIGTGTATAKYVKTGNFHALGNFRYHTSFRQISCYSPVIICLIITKGVRLWH